MSLVSLLRGLSRANIQLIVVGGIAARAHGSAQVTMDVDICYATTKENEERLLSFLRDVNARPRDVAPGRPFIIDRAYLKTGSPTRLITDQGYLDLMREVPGLGPYPDVAAFCVTMPIGDDVLPVVSIEKLIRAKRHAGRGKDIEVAHELEAIKALKYEKERLDAEKALAGTTKRVRSRGNKPRGFRPKR